MASAIFLLAVLSVRGQQEASFAHYWAMEPQFNPAAVGKESKLNVTAAYNMTLVGYEHHPRTMYAAADLPFRALNRVHGVGVQLLSDEVGLFSHQRLLLQYAVKQCLWGGVLSVGLQAGVLSEGFKGSGLELENASDPAFVTSDVTGAAFDLSAGLYYSRKDWFVGVSVLHATAPTVEIGERSDLEVGRAYYLTGGYNIRLRNPFLTIHPTFLARTDGTARRLDVTARLKYSNDGKMLYGGLAYSPSNSVTALVGGSFHGVCLGYSYEMFTTATGGLGNGAHELFVGYQMDVNIGKKGRNRHQSVRIL